MMNFNKHPASGRASALRYNLAAAATIIFKTRSVSCGIAVRAEIENLMDSKKKRPLICYFDTSFGDRQRTIPSFSPARMRFPDDCLLKTANSQIRCTLRFPYGTSRSHSNGLLEQMP